MYTRIIYRVFHHVQKSAISLGVNYIFQKDEVVMAKAKKKDMKGKGKGKDCK
jgi:hypothetical protein